jgi:hypothetical protein
MGSKMIYISGAISCLPNNEWKANFDNAERKLKRLFSNDIIINPTKLIPYQGEHSWRAYMRSDIYQLALCDEIWVMPNWWKSKGCIVEILVSLVLGVKIFSLKKEWLL